MNENKDRRSFFKLLGAGAVGASLASFGKSAFSKARPVDGNKDEWKDSKVKVNIHPNAVKRNKKG